MTTSENNIVNKPANDPIDQLILEKGLRVKELYFNVELDRMLVLLTTGNVLNMKLSSFERLRSATLQQLTNYELIANGVGISWEDLDEDLSLKGFIKQAALTDAVERLEAAV